MCIYLMIDLVKRQKINLYNIILNRDLQSGRIENGTESCFYILVLVFFSASLL